MLNGRRDVTSFVEHLYRISATSVALVGVPNKASGVAAIWPATDTS